MEDLGDTFGVQVVEEGGLGAPRVAVWGRIENCAGGSASGWLYSPTRSVRPVLLVDGKPAELTAWPLDRTDVSRAIGAPAATGFRFSVQDGRAGDAVDLFSLSSRRLVHVAGTTLPDHVASREPTAILEDVQALAADPAAVAVTVWDGAHNPLGRAKVLYDVAATRGPVVLFCYRFDEFGSELWAPMRDIGLTIVEIPWSERALYHHVLEELDVKFRTVWMCKPRYPTFELAARIAHPDARLVLDLDDNEEQFAMSKGSRRKIYGLPSIGRNRQLMQHVHARTVASASLQQDFGGHLVRHARVAHPVPPADGGVVVPVPGRTVERIAFVGTVRPHKNLLSAARAVGVAKWLTHRNLELHVLGDIAPEKLNEELVASGAVVGGIVPVDALPDVLGTMDCLLTGFPSSDPDHEEITRYQISAKIGDALAAGKPVLVPDGPSVADLAGVPGIFLFDEANFPEKLCEALDHEGSIELPHAFTLEGAGEGFAAALAEADANPRAGAALESVRVTWSTRPEEDVVDPVDPDDTLLLLWKQQDAGLYGRRVDQIARAYRRSHPRSRVVVLELAHEKTLEELAKGASSWTSDARQVLELGEQKAGPGLVDPDHVEYRQIRYASSDGLLGMIREFLLREGMFPRNTQVVLFPIVRFAEKWLPAFARYPLVVDVVDNQFSWPTSAEAVEGYAWQYHVLARRAGHVVFNSADNLAFFREAGVFREDGCPVTVIPNWYSRPSATRLPGAGASARTGDLPTVVYSGNLSDRVDWAALHELVSTLDIRLSLVGSASRAGDDFDRLLAHERVSYFGPLDEGACLRLLEAADLAVMPHLLDEVSRYMNPLKLHMYEAAGLPVVVSDVPGLSAQAHTDVTVSPPGEFVATVRRVLARVAGRATTAAPAAPPEPEEYVKMLVDNRQAWASLRARRDAARHTS